MKKFTASVKNRNISVHQSVEFSIFMQEFEGKDIQLHIKEMKNRDQRSLEQNNMYWSIITHIAKYEGNDVMDQHLYFKQNFFSKPIIKKFKNGNGYQIPQSDVSTTDCDTKEFSEVMDRIIKYATHPDYLGMTMEELGFDKGKYEFSQ